MAWAHPVESEVKAIIAVAAYALRSGGMAPPPKVGVKNRDAAPVESRKRAE
jgi:hypothetical protein